MPKIDKNKETAYIKKRNEHVQKLTQYNLTKIELFDIIFNKFANVLDEEIYKEWKKEYDFRQTTNKYNL